jgi:transketolase
MGHLSPATKFRSPTCHWLADGDYLRRQGILKLLAVKESDVRILSIEQCRTSVDKGMHSGGAFSATIPLVALFYGGFMNLDIVEPTRRGQDIFVLSKGHAVAALASIYAELGYFDKSHLANSRSYASILNGHPGPILPGVHIATGPMGQGLGVAQGFAIAGRTSPRFDVYTMTGDGELQEGPIWEAVMYAGAKRLDNLCVLVDRNNGQLDLSNRMVFPMPDLESVFSSFGWRVDNVDATQLEPVYQALGRFRFGPRNGQPTVIICNSSKGYGGLSDFLNKHKVTASDPLLEQELSLQAEQRCDRVLEFSQFYERLDEFPRGAAIKSDLEEIARQIHLNISSNGSGNLLLESVIGPVLTRRAPNRDKKIRYDPAQLPKLDRTKEYAASDIVTGAMKVFARDARVVSIDSDLGTTSGLEAGVGAVDQKRALNVGVAEANMMLIGEAFAALGDNTWVSTFCPFFDWKVLRRIAVGHQERIEAMADSGSWLSDGHGLDLTMLATAANFETRVNGATHMGNDDNLIFDGIAQLRIIDVSCPQQLLAVMQWIMEGNRGLVYVRIMRTGSVVLYGPEYRFEFGKGSVLRETPEDIAVIVSSGRGTHEALAAAQQELLLRLYDSSTPLFIAEQNNGFIWQNFLKVLYRNRSTVELGRIFCINTLDREGRPRFIHSGTYEELVDAFGLAPAQIAETIQRRVLGQDNVESNGRKADEKGL